MVKINRMRHIFLTTVVLLIVIFILGVLIGRRMSDNRVDEISSFIKNNELNTESYLIEQELIENFEQGNCELADARISGLSEELWKIGKSLSPVDAQQSLGEYNYNFLKRKYHLLQIRTYLLFYQFKQHCNTTESIVLFYFSKDGSDSEEQGKILDRLVKNYGITVFAVEHNYSTELSFVEEYYGIKETPALVIDYGPLISGLASYDEVEALIKR